MSKKKVEALKDVLEFASKKLGEASSREVVKTVKLEKSWLKMIEEREECKKEANRLANKARFINSELWGTIRRELNYPDYNLSINMEDGTVEFFEGGDEDDNDEE